MQPTILITIDVEDWFQVENFRPWIPFETWDQRELRVEQNTHKLLNLFDSIELKAHCSKLKEANDLTLSTKPAPPPEATGQIAEESMERSAISYQLSAMSYEKSHPKVTFFILGWIADKLPHLIREIHSRGHEVASHGFNHKLCSQLSDAEFKKDLIDSKKKLEDITGAPVAGYRAPNFSINDDSLKLIEDSGYLYDSSYNSFSLHGRYGKASLNGSSKIGLTHKISDHFFELPISNIHFKHPLSFEPSALSAGQNTKRRFVLPFGGGAYFRLMPFPIFKLGVKKILSKESAYLFYIHPWELDPEQPVVKNASARFKFRHYSNLSKSLNKLIKFIDSFPKCQFITCSRYLSKFTCL